MFAASTVNRFWRESEPLAKLQIHPTAIIEACHIGDNVVVGPYSGEGVCLGDGVKIEEYATVNILVGAETQ